LRTVLLSGPLISLIPGGPKAGRERIERQADFNERANLLAVTQVFSRLRFPSPKLLEILGGSKIMAESPLIRELVAEELQNVLLEVLEERFQTVSSDLAEQVRAVTRAKKLKTLIRKASVSRDLEAFRDFLLTQ